MIIDNKFYPTILLQTLAKPTEIDSNLIFTLAKGAYTETIERMGLLCMTNVERYGRVRCSFYLIRTTNTNKINAIGRW